MRNEKLKGVMKTENALTNNNDSPTASYYPKPPLTDIVMFDIDRQISEISMHEDSFADTIETKDFLLIQRSRIDSNGVGGTHNSSTAMLPKSEGDLIARCYLTREPITPRDAYYIAHVDREKAPDLAASNYSNANYMQLMFHQLQQRVRDPLASSAAYYILPSSLGDGVQNDATCPELTKDVLDLIKRNFRAEFFSLPVMLRDPHRWLRYAKFCLFTGTPIHESNLHWESSLDSGNGLEGEDKTFISVYICSRLVEEGGSDVNIKGGGIERGGKDKVATDQTVATTTNPKLDHSFFVNLIQGMPELLEIMPQYILQPEAWTEKQPEC
jgi:hypothetical protein